MSIYSFHRERSYYLCCGLESFAKTKPTMNAWIRQPTTLCRDIAIIAETHSFVVCLDPYPIVCCVKYNYELKGSFGSTILFLAIGISANLKLAYSTHCTFGPIALKSVVWYISKKYLTMNEPYQKRVQKILKIRKLYSPDPESGKFETNFFLNSIVANMCSQIDFL